MLPLAEAVSVAVTFSGCVSPSAVGVVGGLFSIFNVLLVCVVPSSYPSFGVTATV